MRFLPACVVAGRVQGMERFEVVIAKGAEDDLEGIYRYIANADGDAQANEIEERLIRTILSLETSPSRGKIPPEMLKLGVTDFRELQSSPWRIFYYIAQNRVGVVAVLDGRRNIAELLQQRLLK